MSQSNMLLNSQSREPAAADDELTQLRQRVLQLEEELAHSENRFAVVIKAINAGYYDHFVPVEAGSYHSGRWAEILGYRRNELPPSSQFMPWLLDQVHPDDIPSLMDAYEAFVANPDVGYDVEIRLRHKSRDWVFVRGVSYAQERDENGRVQRIVGIMMDITKMKQAEKERLVLQTQLQQAQKMEALARLAGTIAHDFNNLLVPIITFTELVYRRLDPASKEAERLELAVRTSHRAKDLIAQFLTFARGSHAKKMLIHLETVMNEITAQLSLDIPPSIQVKTSISAGIPPVLANASQMHQVIMNLCTNAIHAMSDGGQLTLELSFLPEFQFIRANAETITGSFVCCRVTDTGFGMDKKIADRILEPFFTTKDKGKGTGLGLSIVYNIIEQHNGWIDVESWPGKGTTFSIYLPATEEEMVQADKLEPVTMLQNPCVLLVDDEPGVQEAGKAILEEIGCRVMAFTDAREALQAFQAAPETFDLIITDYIMPHMNGEALAAEIRAIASDLPILLCTGYNDSITQGNMEDSHFTAILIKPYTLTEIEQALDILL